MFRVVLITILLTSNYLTAASYVKKQGSTWGRVGTGFGQGFADAFQKGYEDSIRQQRELELLERQKQIQLELMEKQMQCEYQMRSKLMEKQVEIEMQKYKSIYGIE